VIDINERFAFLTKAIGPGAIARDGVNAVFKCPNCGKDPKKMKLVVKIDDERWHCWVCDVKGGSIRGLLRKYAPQTVNDWSRLYGTKGRSTFLDETKAEAEKVEFPEMLPVSEIRLSKDPDAKAICAYLKSRDISDELAYRYRLCGSIRGKARRRVVFPSFDSEGLPNYWTARSVDKNTTMRYLNPKIERKDIIFNEVDTDWSSEITLVEGPFDMLRAGDNAVPLLGSSLSNESLLFRRIVENATPVVLALDGDVKKKSHNIARLLYSYDVEVRLLETGNVKDVGDMTFEEFLTCKKRATHWKPEDRLSFLIRGISSGSIL